MNAETIVLNSSQDVRCEAGGKMTLKSAKDMTQTCQTSWAVRSTGAMKLESCDSFTASAVANAKLSGLNVAVSGTARAELTAPMTTVGEGLTTVKGTLVKVEGQMIKLG